MGVVEDVPVEGDPRALATVGAGPLFMAGLAAGIGIGTKITLLATIAAFTRRGGDPGRAAALAARPRHLAGRGRDHLRLLVRAQLRLRPQPVPADPQDRPDPPARPGSGQPLPATAPQAERVLQRPAGLAAQALPGPARPARAALAGDPRRGGRRPRLGVLQGRQRADADPGRHRHGRRDRLHLHAADRLGEPVRPERVRRQPALRLSGPHGRLPAAPADPVVPPRAAPVDPDRAVHRPADPGDGHPVELGVQAPPRLDRTGLPDRRRPRSAGRRLPRAPQPGAARLLRARHGDHGRRPRPGARELLPRPPLRHRRATAAGRRVPGLPGVAAAPGLGPEGEP